MNFSIRHGVLLAAFLAAPAQAKWSTMPNPDYVPPGTPVAQTAVVSAFDDTAPPSLLVVIKSIDGQKYKCRRGMPNCSFLVRLTAGKHQIGLGYANMGGLSSYQSANPVLDVDLQPGTVYVVRVSLAADRVTAAAVPFQPGTPYTFPAGFPMRKKSSLEGLFLDPAETSK